LQLLTSVVDELAKSGKSNALENYMRENRLIAGGKKVLLVHHDKNLTEIMISFLNTYADINDIPHPDVDVASSYEDALEKAGKKQYETVVTALRDSNTVHKGEYLSEGYDFLGAVRDALPKAQLVVFSGIGNLSDVQSDAKKAGADYVTDDVNEAISRILELDAPATLAPYSNRRS